MVCADRWIAAVRTFEADDGNPRVRFVQDCHVHCRSFGPKAEQAPAPLRQLAYRDFPDGSIDNRSRPGAVWLDFAALPHEIGQRSHMLLLLSKKASDMLEPGDERRGKIDARDQNQ